MNRTKIEWCTHTWNPMTGCLHGCPYCYARKIAERFKGTKAWPEGFKPVFHENRLKEPFDLKKPAIVFAGSVTDIFGYWWTEEEILKVLRTMDCFRGAHWHKFVVLTKNPARMVSILGDYPRAENYLQNIYFGTSVTGYKYQGIESSRLCRLKEIHDMGFKTVVSFEPLLEDPSELIWISGGISWADWIIIGGQTNPQKLPEGGWLNSIHHATDKPKFYKLNCFYEQHGVPAQFPVDLLPIAQAWGKA